MDAFLTAAPFAELFAAHPLHRAMPDLLPAGPNLEAAKLAAAIETDVSVAIAAAIWLYVDDLDRSHTISQGIPGPVGAYWHGIMHRREGDFSNAKYWFRQAGPVSEVLAGSLSQGDAGPPQSKWDPTRFVDKVEAERGTNPANLVEMQRREWMALFNYCANGAGAK